MAQKIPFYPKKNSHIFLSWWEHGTGPRNTNECKTMTMVETLPTTYPTLKYFGVLRSHNNSNTSSRKECEKDGTNKPIRDEGDDAISSH